MLQNEYCEPDYEFLVSRRETRSILIRRKKTLFGVWYYGYTSADQTLPDLSCFCYYGKNTFVLRDRTNQELFNVNANNTTFRFSYKGNTCGAIRFRNYFNKPTAVKLIMPNVVSESTVPTWNSKLSHKQVTVLINTYFPAATVYYSKIPVKTNGRPYYHLPFSQDNGVASVKNFILVDSRSKPVFEFLKQEILSEDKRYQQRGKQMNQFGIVYRHPISTSVAFAIAVARCRL